MNRTEWSRTRGHAERAPGDRATIRGATYLIAVASAVSVACAAPMGEETNDDGDGEVAASEAPLVIDGADWLPLANSDSSATYEHGTLAIYGRAVAEAWHFNDDMSASRCSGTLIQDDVYVTAAHCRLNRHHPKPFIVVNLGHYATPGGAAGDYSLALAEARQRVRDLGVPAAVANGLSDGWLDAFMCFHDQRAPGNRDIDYYRCVSKTLSWEQGGITRTARIFPGQIWGHAVATRDPNEGTCRSSFCRSTGGGGPYTANVVSANARCGVPSIDLVLSVAKRQAGSACHGDFEHCFHHEADTVGGSSGAPVFNQYGRMYGVHGGAHQGWWGNPDDPCESWSSTWSWNIGTWFSSALDGYLDAPHGGASPRGVIQTTTVVGGSGGVYRDFACPAGMVAGGVIGTTAEDGRVGNFGLVCVPNLRENRHRLDRAAVIAGGSSDTDFHVSWGDDLMTTLAETRSSSWRQRTVGVAGMQTLEMCAPGTFLAGVTFIVDGVVGRVPQIRCTDPDADASHIQSTSIGSVSAGSWRPAHCPRERLYSWSPSDEQLVVTGMRVRSGWLTDQVQLECQHP